MPYTPRLIRQGARRVAKPVRAVHGEVARNPGHLLAAGALGVGAGSQVTTRNNTDRRTRRRADDIAGAAAGGLAGDALFIEHGYKLKRMGHQTERWNRDFPMSRSQHDKLMRAHNRKHGVKGNTRPEPSKQPAYFRDYPKGLPATPYKHALGRISGNKGRAIQAGVSLGGAMLVGGSTHGVNRLRDHLHDRRQPLAKALYQRGESTNPLRSLEFGAGVTLAALGAGRSPMLGAALARGVRAAQRRDSALAIDTLRMAQAAQGVLARGARVTERQARQVQAIDSMIRKVPPGIRPEVAVGAGLLLAGHASPTTTTRYRPVNIRVNVVGPQR